MRKGMQLIGEESQTKKIVLTDSNLSSTINLEGHNQQQITAQLLEMKKAFWSMSNRLKDQTEQLNALTCSIQELQHDNDTREQKQEPFDNDPKLQEFFKVSQAWAQSNAKNKRLD